LPSFDFSPHLAFVLSLLGTLLYNRIFSKTSRRCKWEKHLWTFFWVGIKYKRTFTGNALDVNNKITKAVLFDRNKLW